jgi:hypothetical protein
MRSLHPDKHLGKQEIPEESIFVGYITGKRAHRQEENG